ncbi:MAG TPA: ATP-binding protein [Rhodanobacteraceae bacterium]|jgi:anti-anti-sigma factor|nr:ATP-binding protein [Rhodanobacteraceae bacterium]
MSQRSVSSAPGSAAQDTLRERRDFARSFDSLEQIFAMVRLVLDTRGVSEADAYAIAMAIEELFTNMVKYNARGLGRIGLEIECTGEDVICSLTDPDSERFDINAMPDANVHLPVEQRRPGGLGIHLIRRMVDSIDYDYTGRRSRITFRKTLNRAWAEPAGGDQGRSDKPPSAGQLPEESTGDDTMFEIGKGPDGTIVFSGRLDAAQCAKAEAFIDAAGVVQAFDFAGLEYISSAGLGVLLRTHKRLLASGARLRLINVNSHIFDIFRFSGFDQVFDVQRGS